MKVRLLTWGSVCLVAAAAGVSTAADAAVIFSDNFESYADTAAMQAVWGSAGVGTLDPTTGNPGKSIKFNVATTAAVTSNQHTITGTTPSDANPITWEFDFLDDGIGNKRITGALRDVGGSGSGNQAFLEMGRFNSINDPDTGATISGYGVRTAFIGGPSAASGWFDFAGNPAAKAGWHHFKAVLGATSATFSLDLDNNGTIDGTRTVTISDGGKLYNLVRFGGPSDVSSAGGGGNFDNLVISQIPEPTATLSLAAASGLLAIRRRRGA
jgi:hypothetical protein